MKKVVALLCVLSACIAHCPRGNDLYASVTSEVYMSCTVKSFGGYTLKAFVTDVIRQPGHQQIGYIVVDGATNEPYPWIMRIYTDNKDYQHLAGSIHAGTEKIPQGLIREGGGNLPLQFQSKNTGEEWVYVPDINNANYTSYFAIRDLGPGATVSGNVLREQPVVGIDPRNAAWVAGEDGILFTDDDNIYGDITLPTPFRINLAVQVPENVPRGTQSPSGEYKTRLIFEIISEP